MNDTRRKIPRIVIGGAHSGAGKTTVTLGLIKALQEIGLTVQPFKVGPDYLDTTHHSAAAGRRCRNLDGWMTDRGYVENAFIRAAGEADVAVVEGVMGMFDGLSPTGEEGSTAQMSKWLDAPIILVIDAKGMARSAAAVVKGYSEFDPSVQIGGVIFNNLGSAAHLDLLREAVQAETEVPVLGGLPREKNIELPHRHLGLVTADRDNLADDLLRSLGDLVQQWIDVDKILALARSTPEMTPRPHRLHFPRAGCRIAVAMDKAFHFYYADNLELLEEAGAEIVCFSPLRDKALPRGVCGIYLGGGYPEVYAEELEVNREMREAVKSFARAGGPIYAECGGLMYLCRDIRTREGKRLEMAGVLPLRARMLDRLSVLRYVEVTARGDSILAAAGTVFRGHEFHYSKLEEERREDSRIQLVYDVRGRKAEHRLQEGYRVGNVLASYIHLHFGSNPSLAFHLAKTCSDWALHHGLAGRHSEPGSKSP